MFEKLSSYVYYWFYYLRNRKQLNKLKEEQELEKIREEQVRVQREEELKNSVLINCPYLPERKTSGAACYDLKANLTSSFITFRSGECLEVGTGLRIEIPEGKVGLVFMRSGISSASWLGLANGVGVIDSDYRGEIKLFIRNYSPSKRFVINNGDRVAQLLIVDFYAPKLLNSKNLSETVRSTSGFGSTGVR